jgi:hypothetical protein
MRDSKRSYWIALLIGVAIGVLVGVAIVLGRHDLANSELSQNQARLWEIVLKAIAGYLAIIGAVITAFKYIDERREHRENAQRELRRAFLEQRQAVYLRLGLSLARIMNYDPGDEEWEPAKQEFYRIYWGEVPLVSDEGVAKALEPFSDTLYSATKEEKRQLAELSTVISEACRVSLGETWGIGQKSYPSRRN